MALSIHTTVSDETKAIQPEMTSYANILFTKNNETDVDCSFVSAIIEDYRY